MQKKIIVAANRLPIEIIKTEEFDLQWVGWPGISDLDDFMTEADFKEKLKNEFQSTPILLSKSLVNRYYFGFSNTVLWPLLHYLPNHCEFEEKDYLAYKKVNELFAETIIEQITDPENDLIWIHDYQLMLVPNIIREKIPNAKIGFFLHTPFCSIEIFKIIPHREELLNGLLGANLIGFHTYEYLRQFRDTIKHLLGKECDVDKVHLGTHSVKFGVYPVGVDVKQITDSLNSEAAKNSVKQVNRITKGRKLILGVDRLDYTKGISKRIKGYEKFLDKNPRFASQFVFVQIAVPSRVKIQSYKNLRDEIEELAFEINEKYEDENNPPIHLLFKSFDFEELSAFYKQAEIMLVTPVRDGMNLVAKEYVAVQKDKGVLILSEFAGSAGELGEALLVNPFNTDEIANALEKALNIFTWEKSRRMRSMYQKVALNDIHYWGESFISDLTDFSSKEFHIAESTTILINKAQSDELVKQIKESNKTLIVLDYDGTLVELASSIESVKPDNELLDILNNLSNHPNYDLAIATGRSQENCDEWFNSLNIITSCEHGLKIKWKDETEWYQMLDNSEIDLSWHEPIKELLNKFCRRTPGSLIEEKESSLAWHYRQSDKELGKIQAKELVSNLSEMLANKTAEVLQGKKVVEIRIQGLNKGNLIKRINQLEKKYDSILIIGDDITDEDMFNSFPETAFKIRVSQGISKAKYHFNKVSDVRWFLTKLI
jgi:trehalose 6-phosphate synthase/phosphatase